MVFRVTKYKHNLYKVPNLERNLSVMTHVNLFSLRAFYSYVFIFISVYYIQATMKSIVDNDKELRNKFDERKLTQVSHDFLIYSNSKKNSDVVSQLSKI